METRQGIAIPALAAAAALVICSGAFGAHTTFDIGGETYDAPFGETEFTFDLDAPGEFVSGIEWDLRVTTTDFPPSWPSESRLTLVSPEGMVPMNYAPENSVGEWEDNGVLTLGGSTSELDHPGSWDSPADHFPTPPWVDMPATSPLWSDSVDGLNAVNAWDADGTWRLIAWDAFDDEEVEIEGEFVRGEVTVNHFIPEPASLAMLALGGVVLLRRRRRA